MNSNVKAFLGFVLGAVISGVAVYIYQDKRLSKKFEEELKVYQRKANSSDKNKTDADNGTTTNTPNDTDSKGEDNMKSNIPQDALDAAKKMQEGVQKAKENREKRGERERSKTNYAKLTRSYGNKEEGGEDMTLSEKIVKNQPYYISEEEFIEWDGKDGYRAVDLFYNADDDSVCNASGEVLEDAHIMCGWDILQDLYDGKNGDEVYVRNDNFKEVYCIAKNFMP